MYTASCFLLGMLTPNESRAQPGTGSLGRKPGHTSIPVVNPNAERPPQKAASRSLRDRERCRIGGPATTPRAWSAWRISHPPSPNPTAVPPMQPHRRPRSHTHLRRRARQEPQPASVPSPSSTRFSASYSGHDCMTCPRGLPSAVPQKDITSIPCDCCSGTRDRFTQGLVGHHVSTQHFPAPTARADPAAVMTPPPSRPESLSRRRLWPSKWTALSMTAHRPGRPIGPPMAVRGLRQGVRSPGQGPCGSTRWLENLTFGLISGRGHR